MATITITRPSEGGWKEALKKYMSRASTRPHACQLVAKEFGYSVGYIKKAASKLGLLSSEHNLRCIFSQEEEQALACACIMYSRQGTPLTVDSFVELANFFAERDDKHQISRRFFYSFRRRHTDDICLKNGKITSPTRSYTLMLRKTKEFIREFEEKMGDKNISEKNIVVFDETVIGDGACLPKLITERRKSGGGNANAIASRRRALGCLIPFSLGDGSTPFRVFIINEKTCRKLMIPENPLLPKAEKGLRETPYRLFLSSPTGFLTTELFEVIMNAFIYWWTTTRPSTACILISDNLAIHKNKAIVEKAERSGIYMFNIMPGSSHWFQVHDQLPFAILKKKMRSCFYKCFGDSSTEPGAILQTRMAEFYKAEKDAFNPKSVRDSFALVGLQPYDKNKILNNCRENSPPDTESDEDTTIDRLAQKINMYTDKKTAEIQRLRSSVKRAKDPTPVKPKKRQRVQKEMLKGQVQETGGQPDSSPEKCMHVAAEPPKKRAKLMRVDRKTCASKGCQKTHFWSKKWVFCQKCKKNFCEEHKDELYHHQC